MNPEEKATMDLVPPSEHLCYVRCNFCNTVLAVIHVDAHHTCTLFQLESNKYIYVHMYLICLIHLPLSARIILVIPLLERAWSREAVDIPHSAYGLNFLSSMYKYVYLITETKSMESKFQIQS